MGELNAGLEGFEVWHGKARHIGIDGQKAHEGTWYIGNGDEI